MEHVRTHSAIVFFPLGCLPPRQQRRGGVRVRPPGASGRARAGPRSGPRRGVRSGGERRSALRGQGRRCLPIHIVGHVVLRLARSGLIPLRTFENFIERGSLLLCSLSSNESSCVLYRNPERAVDPPAERGPRRPNASSSARCGRPSRSSTPTRRCRGLRLRGICTRAACTNERWRSAHRDFGHHSRSVLLNTLLI